MTTHSPMSEGAQPPMFGQGSYVLPEHVHTNHPRQGYHGEPAGWNRARGLLIELCRHLRATPIALYHHVECGADDNPRSVIVTAIARCRTDQDTADQYVTVVWRHNYRAVGRQHKGWQLTVNGITPPGGTGRFGAAPPWLARVAASVIHTGHL